MCLSDVCVQVAACLSGVCVQVTACLSGVCAGSSVFE